VRKGNRLTDSVIRPAAAQRLPDPHDLMVHARMQMSKMLTLMDGVR